MKRKSGGNGRETRVGRFFRRVFRERQIYVRSEQSIRFVTLSTRAQAIGCAVLVGLFFWLAFATVNVTFKDQIIALKERRLGQERAAYEDRLSRMRVSIDRLNDRLLLNQRAYLEKVDGLREEYETLLERHRRLESFVQNTWLSPSQDSASPSPDARAETVGGESTDTAPNLRRGMADHEESTLDLRPMHERYAQTFRTEEEGDQPLRDLRSLFVAMDLLQHNMLDRIQGLNAERLQHVTSILKKVRLDPGRIARESSYTGHRIGGPFIGVNDPLADDPLAQRMDEVLDGLRKTEKLHHAIFRLPLYKPMTRYRITSHFGVRRDPFRSVPAMHAGIDLVWEVGAPVIATATGVITHAGPRNAYGNLVEIRHDNGVSTRYAHLKSIDVERGQRVNKGDVVGRLGNTGRSTGPHLHYETRVRGRAINPSLFWQARDDIRKEAEPARKSD